VWKQEQPEIRQDLSSTVPQWIVPPETLLCNALALPRSQTGEAGAYYVLVFTSDPEGWKLTSAAPFVTIAQGPSGTGYLGWTLTVASNTGASRQNVLHLQHDGEAIEIPLVQAGSAWLQELARMVLHPPPGTGRAKFPLAMELGAAGKFIGEILKKIPLPYRLAAYAAVSGIIVGLGTTVIVARATFTTVPEPPNYFSVPPGPLMTLELIAQQTALLIGYIGTQMQ
jgi:hypothetical protein